MSSYRILKLEGRAKRAEFQTVHGTIQTPVFMNVGTAAAIKGAVSTEDLEGIGTQVELSNTYHLHVRPGDEVVKKMGGIHKFMSWNKPVLTDSGGFQVFSLATSAKDQRRRGFISVPMWMAGKFSWGRRRVCRFSPIWRPPSPWPLTSALPAWQTALTSRPLWTGRPGGWSAVR